MAFKAIKHDICCLNECWKKLNKFINLLVLWFLHPNAIIYTFVFSQSNDLEHHTFYSKNSIQSQLKYSTKSFMIKYESMPEKHFDLPIMMNN